LQNSGRANDFRAANLQATSGDVHCLVERPAISGVHPSDGLVGGAFQRDATTISRGVSGRGSGAQLDVLVIDGDGGAVDTGDSAIHREIAADRQVVANSDVVWQANSQRAAAVAHLYFVCSALNSQSAAIRDGAGSRTVAYIKAGTDRSTKRDRRSIDADRAVSKAAIRDAGQRSHASGVVVAEASRSVARNGGASPCVRVIKVGAFANIP